MTHSPSADHPDAVTPVRLHFSAAERPGAVTPVRLPSSGAEHPDAGTPSRPEHPGAASPAWLPSTGSEPSYAATPVWLLDVDGVLNANRPGWGAAPRRGTAYADGIGWTMRWAPALLDHIRTLHRSGTVEIRWCTTWCPHAGQLERLFALPQLEPCWHDNLAPPEAAVAKLAAAHEVLKSGRPLIWTDDADIPPAAHEELPRLGRTLLITPRPNRGLQPEHLDAIEAFVA